jgi:hypothetical protein
MRSPSVFPDTVIPYSASFSAFLASFVRPVAILPPSLHQILGAGITGSDLAEACFLIGFKETRNISSGIGSLSASLELESKSKDFGPPLLFTACPGIRSIAAAEFPRIEARFSTALPPAERVGLKAREDRPDATLFFLSPCSSRAEALLAETGAKGKPLIDYAVPLHTIYPAILKALETAAKGTASPGAVPEGICGLGDGPVAHVGGTSGRKRVVDSPASIRAFFDEISRSSTAVDESYLELVECAGGCSRGDWAPRR